jgi:hypothetical protein
MGQKVSKEVVSNYLNNVTSEAILNVNQDCIVPAFLLQDMFVKCDISTTDAQGNPIHHEANEGCYQCVEGIRQEMRNRLLVIDPLTWERGNATLETKKRVMEDITASMERCLIPCKQCIFSNNRQNVMMKSSTDCQQDVSVVNKVRNAITEKIRQDMSRDEDIFSKVVGLLPTFGTDESDVNSMITNNISNKVTTNLLNQVQADLQSNQVMRMSGADGSFLRGDSQTSLLARTISTIQKADVHTDFVNKIDITAAQKLVDDENTAKKLFATIGNLARQIADVLTSGVGLIIIIVIVAVFIVGIVMLTLFVKTGKSVTGIFKPSTYTK